MKHLTGMTAAVMIITMLWTIPAGSGAEPGNSTCLTLDAAKSIAVENSPTLASAKERVVQARETVIQARSSFFPSVDHAASWTHTRDHSDGMDNNQYSNSLSATLTLFDGFLRKHTLLSARWNQSISQESLQESRSFLVWSVASGYLNVQLARESITIATSDMAYNQRLAKEAKAKQDAGTGSLSDVLNFETAVNSARAALITAEQDHAEALYALAALMGIQGSCFPATLTLADLDIDPENMTVPEDINACIARALERRPDLSQAKLSVTDSEAAINAARAGFYPTLSLGTSYGSSGPWDTVSSGPEQDASLGLALTFNLFSGGITRSKVAEAVSRKREAVNTLEAKRLEAMSEIRSAVSAVKSARQQLLLQKKNTELVALTRDLVEQEYRAGQTSLVRLNEAQNLLINSMSNLARARVSVVLAREYLDYVTGANLDPRFRP